MATAADILIRKSDLRDTRRAGTEVAAGPGQALLRLSRFSLTANNVTYAAMGEAFGYWKFFPAEEPWGRAPVWGFADVVESQCAELPAGERVWGYFPMASHLVVTPQRVRPESFVDGVAHRAPLPPVYNLYERVAADPGYHAERENEAALFRPLFTTGFLLDDFVAENDAFGARRVLVASASSKTALSMAKLLKARGRWEVVALTSAGSRPFVEKTGHYDRVVTYDAIGSLANDTPAMLVDMAGDTAVLNALADRLGDRFVHDCMVGGAHWDAARTESRGPGRSLFFAPDRIVQRRKDWGADGYAAHYSEAWEGFIASAHGWLEVVEESGLDAAQARWRKLLDGQMKAEEGYIIRL
jgi:NADPH:quinone reductase-like Zn-dependent oxidoreductase